MQKVTYKYKRREVINSIIRGAFLCGGVFILCDGWRAGLFSKTIN